MVLWTFNFLNYICINFTVHSYCFSDILLYCMKCIVYSDINKAVFELNGCECILSDMFRQILSVFWISSLSPAHPVGNLIVNITCVSVMAGYHVFIPENTRISQSLQLFSFW